MRLLLVLISAALLVMSVVAATVVRPERTSSDDVIDAYFTLGTDATHPDVRALMLGFRDHAQEIGLPPVEVFSDLLASDDEGRLRLYRRAFAEFYEQHAGEPLANTPRLVWSTDANPARDVQMALFRTWHLETFGTPCDIDTDPSNRELTKAIVQSVAGAGPDVIEYIGPADLRSLVDAGIALDITDYAQQHGFGADTVFAAARSSIAAPNESGELRQYAYPCNVGYTVLMYHADLFELAGVTPPPADGWTIDQMRRTGERVVNSDAIPSRLLFAVMNLDALNAALAGGGALFSEPHATHSTFNSPETVAALTAYHALMYEHGAMPTPSDAASMSSASGFSGDVAGAAPGLFAQKSIAMYVGGRWEYVTFAITNRDRVIIPAIDRRLAKLDRLASEDAEREAALLRGARSSLIRDVLVPISEAQSAAIDACLSPADRERLLHIEIAHVPTTTGVPSYSASARGAVVNRALERDDPERLVYAKRFLRFLGSAAYNEQINGTYDSICGRTEFCFDDNGIAGPPAPLPGLEGFDSPVFIEAMAEYAEPWRLSPYIGRTRTLTILGEVLEDLQGDSITPAEAALVAEETLNRQVLANVRSKAALREQWTAATGLDPDDITPGRRDASGELVTIRQQIERIGVTRADRPEPRS